MVKGVEPMETPHHHHLSPRGNISHIQRCGLTASPTTVIKVQVSQPLVPPKCPAWGGTHAHAQGTWLETYTLHVTL